MKLLVASVFGIWVTTIVPANRCASSGTAEQERGQWNIFYGNEIFKKIGNAIKNIGKNFTKTTGLDTDHGYISSMSSIFKQRLRAIYPGTLWCGDGAIAKSDTDLGYFKLTDNCCREHDNCNDTMAKGQIRNGLENSGLFTRSNCACDEKFKNCLKRSNTMVSNKIGFTYFTVLGPQCFKFEYPIISCKSKRTDV